MVLLMRHLLQQGVSVSWCTPSAPHWCETSRVYKNVLSFRHLDAVCRSYSLVSAMNRRDEASLCIEFGVHMRQVGATGTQPRYHIDAEVTR